MGSLQGYRQELYDGGGLGIPTRGTRFPIKGARLLIVQKLAFGNEWSQVDFFPQWRLTLPDGGAVSPATPLVQPPGSLSHH